MSRHAEGSNQRQRSLTELIDTGEPAWPLVREWLQAARHPTVVLPVDRARGEGTLLALQITTRSPLGAVALETRGLLIDHGWLRVLGSGGERMTGNLLTWNGIGEHAIHAPVRGVLVAAHDAIGGFFALSGGALPGKPGDVAYLAPDTLAWEGLEMAYSAFLQWTLTGDLGAFYERGRWPDWEHEVAALDGDEGIHVYPPLWVTGPPVADRSRRAVPMTELWDLHHETAAQLQHLADGAAVELRTVDSVAEDGH